MKFMHYPEHSTWRSSIEVAALLPEGFEVAVSQCHFVPIEKPDAGAQTMNLAVLRMIHPSSAFAGVFTRNAFPGWPVRVGRECLKLSKICGVVVNNKVANVGGVCGEADSKKIAETTRLSFGDVHSYIPSSTGVIGWRLPTEEMMGCLHTITDHAKSTSLMPFAEAIMTTDAWPKVRAAQCGAGRIVGTAKGAGMVEPHMATMLAFITTDVDVPRDTLRSILSRVVDQSFNRISIDGETSTSDTVLMFSSRQKKYPGDRFFEESLFNVCAALAEDVVRNGEGCTHVFRVTVAGASNEKMAVDLARSVVNAPLTKTAIRGNDPNVGRILQAFGAAAGRAGLEFSNQALELKIGGHKVFDNNGFHLNNCVEKKLTQYFCDAEMPMLNNAWPRHEKIIDIVLRIGNGGASGAVLGSDLSEEYIKINADYRT